MKVATSFWNRYGSGNDRLRVVLDGEPDLVDKILVAIRAEMSKIGDVEERR